MEKELLQQIKLCIECENESQAIRLIEQYSFRIKNKLFTNEEVIDIIQKRLLSIRVFSSFIATDFWFKQYKK